MAKVLVCNLEVRSSKSTLVILFPFGLNPWERCERPIPHRYVLNSITAVLLPR